MADEKKPATRIRETRVTETGFGHPDLQEDRVRTLPDGEAVPAGAETVADDTPLHGWQPVKGV
jgi:hypothetical protein